MSKCYFCKEEKEVGKQLFWCHRLRSFDNMLTYYGSWVCVDCCKEKYFKGTYDKHTSRSWSHSCAECDFPVGAIVYANQYRGKPPTEYIVQKRQDKWLIDPIDLIGYLDYYGFKWDHHLKKLILIRRSFVEGICTVVIKKKQLPTRKIILLEDTIYFDALSWSEVNHYYYSSCKDAPQHFDEEEWMDQAPVIICSGYLGKEGFQFDKKFKKKIEALRKKLIAEVL